MDKYLGLLTLGLASLFLIWRILSNSNENEKDTIEFIEYKDTTGGGQLPASFSTTSFRYQDPVYPAETIGVSSEIPGVRINPDGGDRLEDVLSDLHGSERPFQEQFASLGVPPFQDIATAEIFIDKATQQDQARVDAVKSICSGRPVNKGVDGATCRLKNDLNYVTRTDYKISNNTTRASGNPFDVNQSEFYNQFYRDTQNNLSNHQVDNYLYPYSSQLTSSYRNSAQYCGVGKTTRDRVLSDRCFDTAEYHSTGSKNAQKSLPDVINTQIKPYDRRFRPMLKYTPVKNAGEIIPVNGYLNEKPANFTSEHTRTFDHFTHAGTGFADYLY